jgi:hypothetical protein
MADQREADAAKKSVTADGSPLRIAAGRPSDQEIGKATAGTYSDGPADNTPSSSAASALAVSLSGPGGGTNTVAR